jgi:hypothetical protein
MNAEHTSRKAVRASRDSASPDTRRPDAARLIRSDFGRIKASDAILWEMIARLARR